MSKVSNSSKLPKVNSIDMAVDLSYAFYKDRMQSSSCDDLARKFWEIDVIDLLNVASASDGKYGGTILMRPGESASLDVESLESWSSGVLQCLSKGYTQS